MRQNNNREALYEALTNISDLEDMKTFLLSLCSDAELNKMAQRLYVAELFIKNYKYRDIVNETDASTATLAKIKYDLYYGNRGLLKGLEAL